MKSFLEIMLLLFVCMSITYTPPLYYDDQLRILFGSVGFLIIGTIWGIGGMLLIAFFIVMERQRKRAERGQMRAVLTMMGL